MFESERSADAQSNCSDEAFLVKRTSIAAAIFEMETVDSGKMAGGRLGVHSVKFPAKLARQVSLNT